MARNMDGGIQWQNAQDWLYSTGKLSQSCNEILNFAMNLVDGVVLCEVANFLHPGAIKNFYWRPSIQFMCLKNIDNFLNACIKFFGFQTHELFTATELLEVENFGKVVEVLSKLSQTNQAKNRGLIPYHYFYDDQEVYNTLQRDAESRSEEIYSRIDDFVQFERSHDYSYQDSYQQESIYEDIVKIKQYRMDKPNDKRGYMIDEIFETEKNYVQVLEILISHFLDKLKPILTIQDIKDVFQNIEELKNVHEKLLQRLKLSIDNGGTTIGDQFVKTIDQLLKYGNYCACLDTASQKLDELMLDSKIANNINRCLQESQQRFSLKDLLKVPAQRILKYPMLLENLLKDSPQNLGLQEGFRVMKTLASYINEYKRNYEQMLATRSIEERISNKDDLLENLLSYGKLLKDGEVMVKTNNTKSNKRFAFLFEKCILICKKSEHSNLEIQVALDFETYEIADHYDSPGGGKFSFGWSMKNKVDMLLPAYQIMVKNAEQCPLWLSKFDEGYTLLRSPAHLRWDHSFSLKDYTNIVKCSVCAEQLSGVFAQGLYCSTCYISCHRHCKPKVLECKKQRISRGSSYNKELPLLPSQTSLVLADHVETDGPPAPPPIPPRAPSIKDRRSIPNTPTTQFSSRSPSFDRCPTASPQQFTIQGDLYVCIRDFNGSSISDMFEPTIVINNGEFVEVTKKEHPMYWKGKSQSSGLMGYFPSEYVKMYSLSRQDSTASISSLSVRSPSISSQHKLYDFSWFVGEMDRNGGRMMLEPVTVPDGCYLVRESKNRLGQFSIDVKFNFLVKHIKVVYAEENKTYCLAPSKTFNSIVELVKHYQHSTLGQVFRDLQTKLLVPYRSLPGS